MVLGTAGSQVTGIFAHIQDELVDLRCGLLADLDAECFRKGIGHTVTADTCVSRSLVAAWCVTLHLSPLVLCLVIQELYASRLRGSGQKVKRTCLLTVLKEEEVGFGTCILDF